MNFIQQQLEKQQKGKRFQNSKKPPTKLAKPSKNFKPMRAK